MWAGWLHSPCCLGGPQRFRAGGALDFFIFHCIGVGRRMGAKHKLVESYFGHNVCKFTMIVLVLPFPFT